MTMPTQDLGFAHRFERGREDGPVLLLLHGTGGDEDDLLPLGRAILPGASLLSPRGKVLEQGMPRFFRRLALGVFDEDDLKARTQELADFVIAASAQYRFAMDRVIAVGYSNGANIAAALLLLRPEVLSAAILLRATVPLRVATLPDLRGKRSALLSEARRRYLRPTRTGAGTGEDSAHRGSPSRNAVDCADARSGAIRAQKPLFSGGFNRMSRFGEGLTFSSFRRSEQAARGRVGRRFRGYRAGKSWSGSKLPRSTPAM